MLSIFCVYYAFSQFHQYFTLLIKYCRAFARVEGILYVLKVMNEVLSPPYSPQWRLCCHGSMGIGSSGCAGTSKALTPFTNTMLCKTWQAKMISHTFSEYTAAFPLLVRDRATCPSATRSSSTVTRVRVCALCLRSCSVAGLLGIPLISCHVAYHILYYKKVVAFQ